MLGYGSAAKPRSGLASALAVFGGGALAQPASRATASAAVNGFDMRFSPAHGVRGSTVTRAAGARHMTVVMGMGKCADNNKNRRRQ